MSSGTRPPSAVTKLICAEEKDTALGDAYIFAPREAHCRGLQPGLHAPLREEVMGRVEERPEMVPIDWQLTAGALGRTVKPIISSYVVARCRFPCQLCQLGALQAEEFVHSPAAPQPHQHPPQPAAGSSCSGADYSSWWCTDCGLGLQPCGHPL